MNQFEQESAYLDDQLTEGAISLREYNKQLSDLERDYRCAAEEAAEDAYRDALDEWY
jgi:hypothetical protein